jgi:hypothetical protein
MSIFPDTATAKTVGGGRGRKQLDDRGVNGDVVSTIFRDARP